MGSNRVQVIVQMKSTAYMVHTCKVTDQFTDV